MISDIEFKKLRPKKFSFKILDLRTEEKRNQNLTVTEDLRSRRFVNLFKIKRKRYKIYK